MAQDLIRAILDKPEIVQHLNANEIVTVLDMMEKLHCRLLERLIDLHASSYQFVCDGESYDDHIFETY